MLAFVPRLRSQELLAGPSGGLEGPVSRREVLHLFDRLFIKWVADVA